MVNLCNKDVVDAEDVEVVVVQVVARMAKAREAGHQSPSLADL